MSLDRDIELTSLAFATIEQIVQAVANARAGTVSSQTVLDDLAKLHASLTDNNKAADDALAQRFPAP